MNFGPKLVEITKSYSNESIFSDKNPLKYSITPLIPKKSINLKINTPKHDIPLNPIKKLPMKLKKIEKTEKINLISSSLDRNKEENSFSNEIKKTIIQQKKLKEISKKLSFSIKKTQDLCNVEEILKLTPEDLETNFEDPRKPIVYLNMIKKKFLY